MSCAAMLVIAEVQMIFWPRKKQNTFCNTRNNCENHVPTETLLESKQSDLTNDLLGKELNTFVLNIFLCRVPFGKRPNENLLLTVPITLVVVSTSS